MRKRSFFTLTEMMAVILVLGMLLGLVSYNVQGSLQRGRHFITEQGARQLIEFVEMESVRQNLTLEELVKHPRALKKLCQQSGVVRDISSFLSDGWKEPYELQIGDGGVLLVFSRKGGMYDASGRLREKAGTP